MSVMADKNPPAQPAPPHQNQHQQPPPQNWSSYNMNMYNMYPNHYMYPPGYGADYYQYYARMQAQAAAYMQQHPPNQQYRGFSPQGPNMVPPYQQIPPPQTQQQTTQSQENKDQTNKDAMSELPPLPPGPPPPQNQNFTPPKSQPEQQQQPQQSMPPPQQHLQPRGFQPTPPDFQQSPVRFMMNSPRPRMNLNTNNPFVPNQVRNQIPQNPNQQLTTMSKKSKKKKKRQAALLQQQLQQQELLTQQQLQSHSAPPLPATPPPPLPPTPPPPPPPPGAMELDRKPHDLSQPPPPLPPNPKQPMPTVSQVTQQGIRALEEWPASLREYVNKCYAKCVTQMDKDRVGVILKGKLMRATNDGTLWIKDWIAEPLPLLDSDDNAIMNLKEKLKGGIAGRLGPKQKSPSPPPKRRNITKRTYRSDSSSSRSSDGSYDRERSPSPRSPKKSRSSKKQPRNLNKRNYNSNNRQKSHFYSEFGLINDEDITAKKEVLDKRAARFSSGGGQQQSNLSINNHFRKKNQPLFVLDTGSASPNYSQPPQANSNGEFDINSVHVVGTSEDLEKCYLRLTAAPEASQVRPSHVLTKSLEMVKQKWSQGRDYKYACEQLKSIRQDLTVQGIRDKLSVDVYETHARIALEKGDHAEFNQCQSQLRILHSEVEDGKANREEFIAYRILFYIFVKDFMDLNTTMSSLSAKDKQDECISHAIQVCKAWLLSGYNRIFKLYRTAPRMSSYIMDLFLTRERTSALKIIIKAYRPSIPVDFLRSELAFETDTELEEFLSSFGGLVFVDDSRTKIDCKASSFV